MFSWLHFQFFEMIGFHVIFTVLLKKDDLSNVRSGSCVYLVGYFQFFNMVRDVIKYDQYEFIYLARIDGLSDTPSLEGVEL